MIYLYGPIHASHDSLVHLSTDGVVEDCATIPVAYPRERGGAVGDPKAEDLLAQRLARRDYRKCRRCFRYGPRYRNG